MKRALAVLAWLVVLGLVLLVGLRDPAIGRARLDAERMRVVAFDDGAVFPLDPGEDRVRVITWLARPAGWTRDVRATAPFTVELVVQDAAGEEKARQLVWRRARSSWSEARGGVLLRPTWLPGSRDEVSDSRVVELDVAGLVPDGGRLLVRAPHRPVGARVLGVAYRFAPRTRAARLRFLAGGAPSRTEDAAAPITPLGWSRLPLAWREVLSARVWERLSPLPVAGGPSLRTIELMHASPSTAWESQAALGLPVPPGGAMAFNVLQGGALHLRWRDVSGRRADPAPTWLQRVKPDGTAEVRFLGVVDEVGPLTATEPLESLHLALDPGAEGPRVLQARLEGGEALAWGDPPRRPDPERPASWQIAADLRTMELVRLGPGLPPVRFPLEDPAETLRLTLRARLPAAALRGFGLRWDPVRDASTELPPADLAPVTVQVRALDAAGVELARWETRVHPRATPFDRYTQGDDPSGAACAEPEQRYLVPPAQAVRLEVQADGLVDVAMRARHPDNPEPRVARGYVPPPSLSPPPSAPAAPLGTWAAEGPTQGPVLPLARFEPMAQDPWRARGPEELEGLLAEGRIVRIDSQVRVEPPPPWEDEAWMRQALARRDGLPEPEEGEGPEGPPQRGALDLGSPYELLAEPDRDGQGSEGSRTRLSQTAAQVRVPETGRLDLEYRVEDSLAGDVVRVQVGEATLPQRLLATAGRLRLHGLAPGPQLVRVDRPGVFLARAPGRPLWQVRRVVRLVAGQARTLALPARAGSVVVYAYGGGGWIDWTLRGGAPVTGPAMMDRATRRTGRQRLRYEGGTALPLSMGGGELARLTPLVLHLGPDVAAEPSTLSLLLTGAEGPVWIRAAATWADCTGADCAGAAAQRYRVSSR